MKTILQMVSTPAVQEARNLEEMISGVYLAALTVREERRKLLCGNIKNAKVYFSC
jgi:hypothetical protein